MEAGTVEVLNSVKVVNEKKAGIKFFFYQFGWLLNNVQEKKKKSELDLVRKEGSVVLGR